MKRMLASIFTESRSWYFTLPECVRVLGDEPVSCVDICDLCIGKEFLDGRDSVEGYIMRFGSSDEKGGSFIFETIRVTEWEVCHIVECLAKY